MTVGYPDYSRLSRAGSYQLYNTSTTPPVGVILFKGYVGSWPYVNLFTAASATADFARLKMIYFPDDTFTGPIAYRYAIRDQYAFGGAQYANMSDWLEFSYDSISGVNFPFTEVSLYATTGHADSKQLTSMDVPVIGGTYNLGSTSTTTDYSHHTQPGPAFFSVQTAATSWYINVSYYDYGSAAWVLIRQYNNTSNGGSAGEPLPLMDAPYKIDIHNGDAVLRAFVVQWAST